METIKIKQELVDRKTNKRADREREGRYSTLIINIIRRSFEISGCDFLELGNKIQEELFIYLNKYLLLLLDTAPLALLLHFLHRSITALIMLHAATSSSDLAILHAAGSKGIGRRNLESQSAKRRDLKLVSQLTVSRLGMPRFTSSDLAI